MHVEEFTAPSQAAKLSIYRRIARPLGETHGATLLLHGLGDHQGCHEEAAALFARHGVATLGLDWPGNGRSDGRRGDIASVETACDLIDESLAQLRQQFPNVPIGLYAHSTGAFFALRHLALRQTNPFRWIWLSSPLIDPSHRQSTVLQTLAPLAAAVLPRWTVSNGVTRAMCQHTESELDSSPPTKRVDGRHRRVSLRLGASLLAHAKQLPDGFATLRDPTKLLVTQGDEDEVCPARFSRPLFDRIAIQDKQYAELTALRHEPYFEPLNQQFLDIAETWVANVIRIVLPTPSEPKTHQPRSGDSL